MKFTITEMNGLLNGKCIPTDLLVGETLSAYLVRKLSHSDQQLTESERYGRQADITIENLERKVEQLAAETYGFKRFFLFAINAAFDGCDVTGDQIQEVAKEIGLVRVEPYSSEKHAEMSDDPSIMEEGDDFYIMNKTPATDAILAELQAQGVEMMVEQCELDIVFIEPEDEEHYTLMIEHAKEFAAQLRKGMQS